MNIEPLKFYAPKVAKGYDPKVAREFEDALIKAMNINPNLKKKAGSGWKPPSKDYQDRRVKVLRAVKDCKGAFAVDIYPVFKDHQETTIYSDLRHLERHNLLSRVKRTRVKSRGPEWFYTAKAAS